MVNLKMCFYPDFKIFHFFSSPLDESRIKFVVCVCGNNVCLHATFMPAGRESEEKLSGISTGNPLDCCEGWPCISCEPGDVEVIWKQAT